MKSKNTKNTFTNLLDNAGMNPEEASQLLGVSSRTVRRWYAGEIEPKKAYLDQMEVIVRKVRRAAEERRVKSSEFRFIDLFAGIGGIRIPFEELNGECVFTSEWDKFSKKTYFENFKEMPHGDIVPISSKDIPTHDVLLAGFPCQAFSQAGLKQGFMDTRGTMFFEIQRILSHHRPKAFLLENVKQLRGHDKGRTLKSILDILRGKSEHDIPDNIPMSAEARKSLSDKLNYWVPEPQILRAADFGVPQNRERIFIVGFNKDHFPPDTDFESIFQWPEPENTKTRLGDILFPNKDVDEKYTISDRLWAGHQRRKREHKEKGNGFGYSLFNSESPYANTISARYYKDGSEILIDQSDIGKNPRKLTPRECARLQGFPESYIVDAVSDAQAYRQFGNAVAIPVIRAVAREMVRTMKKARSSFKKAA